MNTSKMLTEYEKHKNKKYTFSISDMNAVQEESKDNFGRMLNSFRYGYVQGRRAAIAEMKKGGM